MFRRPEVPVEIPTGLWCVSFSLPAGLRMPLCHQAVVAVFCHYWSCWNPGSNARAMNQSPSTACELWIISRVVVVLTVVVLDSGIRIHSSRSSRIVSPMSWSRLGLETLTSWCLLGLGIIHLIYNSVSRHSEENSRLLPKRQQKN